jgi:hypothetical protein
VKDLQQLFRADGARTRFDFRHADLTETQPDTESLLGQFRQPAKTAYVIAQLLRGLDGNVHAQVYRERAIYQKYRLKTIFMIYRRRTIFWLSGSQAAGPNPGLLIAAASPGEARALLSLASFTPHETSMSRPGQP